MVPVKRPNPHGKAVGSDKLTSTANTPGPLSAATAGAKHAIPSDAKGNDPFARAENEDDDGYDPWSDRKPKGDPMFEKDPWD